MACQYFPVTVKLLESSSVNYQTLKSIHTLFVILGLDPGI